jgi:hypothetical protein
MMSDNRKIKKIKKEKIQNLLKTEKRDFWEQSLPPSPLALLSCSLSCSLFLGANEKCDEHRVWIHEKRT